MSLTYSAFSEAVAASIRAMPDIAFAGVNPLAIDEIDPTRLAFECPGVWIVTDRGEWNRRGAATIDIRLGVSLWLFVDGEERSTRAVDLAIALLQHINGNRWGFDPEYIDAPGISGRFTEITRESWIDNGFVALAIGFTQTIRTGAPLPGVAVR